MDDRMEKLLDGHLKAGRDHFKRQSQDVERLGRLNSLMIFLHSAGRVPKTDTTEELTKRVAEGVFPDEQ